MQTTMAEAVRQSTRISAKKQGEIPASQESVGLIEFGQGQAQGQAGRRGTAKAAPAAAVSPNQGVKTLREFEGALLSIEIVLLTSSRQIFYR